MRGAAVSMRYPLSTVINPRRVPLPRYLYLYSVHYWHAIILPEH